MNTKEIPPEAWECQVFRDSYLAGESWDEYRRRVKAQIARNAEYEREGFRCDPISEIIPTRN